LSAAGAELIAGRQVENNGRRHTIASK